MFVYVDGYGFYQLLTFLDAFSRLAIHHELLAQVSSEATATALKKAVERSGVECKEGLSYNMDVK